LLEKEFSSLKGYVFSKPHYSHSQSQSQTVEEGEEENKREEEGEEQRRGRYHGKDLVGGCKSPSGFAPCSGRVLSMR
jgi:hypothetical protein